MLFRLCGSRPRVWRRFQLEDATVGELHVVIQFVMGWQFAHLHQFDINDEVYQPSIQDEFGFGIPTKDEDDFLLSDVLPKGIEPKDKFRFLYTYDMGDNWEHEIVFAGYQPYDLETDYPICIGGENACPPEDVGGLWGFYDFLEAVSDPQHSEHEHFIEWIGEFDPDHFDFNEVNKTLRTRLTREQGI